MGQFDVAVAIFIFKRPKAVEIIKRISMVKPQKLYILADNGRNEEEKKLAQECRKRVEEAIDWDCEVIKNYAVENRGVYANIALGAKWVFERENKAIFLEDDNLPEITFFRFCKEMLEKYDGDDRILWVCGTNYLERYKSQEDVSYVFTRHMLPCGWASWGDKFNKFYDGSLNLLESDYVKNNIKNQYIDGKVYRQYRDSWMAEYDRILSSKRSVSWDFQMDFSIKAHNLLGICPCNNQIRNIGVDEYSAHGGVSFDNIMVNRFCSMDSIPIEFPLKHPASVLPDYEFERKIAKIITLPFPKRCSNALLKVISKSIRYIFKIPRTSTVKGHFVSKMKRK